MYKLDTAWDAHIKSKRYLSNEPDKSRKVCEICNIEVIAYDWSKHLKTEYHLKNNPDQIIKPIRPKKLNMPTRLCEKFYVEIALTHPNAWPKHITSKARLENEPDKSRKLWKKCNIEEKHVAGLTI
jgi:hypothetical protein